MKTRLIRITAAVAAALALGGCVSTQELVSNIQRDPTKVLAVVAPPAMSAEDEQILGRNSAAVLLGAAPLVKDAALQQYVGTVGSWVALQTGRSDINWRFGVLDANEVNAFATPGGYILITRGLLARLDNEAQLAGVLAHEISHVTERHYVEAANSKIRAGALADLLTPSGGNLLRNMATEAVSNLSKGIYSAGLDKGDEYQADRYGVLLAARAGYNPWGLPQVLQMYAGRHGQAGFELFFSTHPAPADRIERLAGWMDGELGNLETASVSNTASFDKALKRGKGR